MVKVFIFGAGLAAALSMSSGYAQARIVEVWGHPYEVDDGPAQAAPVVKAPERSLTAQVDHPERYRTRARRIRSFDPR